MIWSEYKFKIFLVQTQTIKKNRKMKFFNFLIQAAVLNGSRVKKGVEPTFVSLVNLSYGEFATYLMEPAELNEAIENCNLLNGRLPRMNNLEDFHKIGELSVRTDSVYTWTSYIDGTLNGEVEHDGSELWYDYYDQDKIG